MRTSAFLNFILSLSWAALTNPAGAQTPLPVETPRISDDIKVRPSTRPILARTEGSEVKIDPNLVDKLFQKTTISASSARAEPSLGRLEVGYSHFVPRDMETRNSYFEVTYHDTASYFPVAQLAWGYPLVGDESVEMTGFVHAGYSYSQGVYEVKGRDTGIGLRDTVSIQWVPIGVGIACECGSAKNFAGFRPLLTVSGGVESITQTGTLDGMSQNYLSSFYRGEAGFTLFASPFAAANSGFDGVSLLIGGRRSLGEDVRVDGVSIEMNTRILL